MSLDRIGVLGTGLVGTSVGMALRATGCDVVVSDRDASRSRAAAALGAGTAVPVGDLRTCDHVVVAVPPRSTAPAIADVLRLTLDLTVSDVSSIKTSVQDDLETLAIDTSRVCGGHPIAGRERHGPGAAAPDLFEGAPWVITPFAGSTEAAIRDATEVAERCGARIVTLPVTEHDAVLAVVSHAPQLLASVLAAQILRAGPSAPGLAGSGFRDTTRLADSDPALWTEIATGNAGALAVALRAVATDLDLVAQALSTGDAGAVTAALQAGREGRAVLPGKAARARPAWARVGVVVPDQPGELARVLAAAGAAGVNVEDLTIEHAADHPAGHVELEVRPDAVEDLVAALGAGGWAAHRTA